MTAQQAAFMLDIMLVHYPSVFDLQNSGLYDEIYIMIADAQALTDNAEHPEKVRQNIIQVALDYLACGIDPAEIHISLSSPWFRSLQSLLSII